MLKTITSVANTVGALEYKGLWNAATNTPTLVSSVGTQGDYYVVSVAGTTNLDGVTTWDEGDWAIFNGSVWQLFQDGQDGVFATLTVSNYAAFADNAKATFGTGAGDLQIYHDGFNSIIYEGGTGDLQLRGNGGSTTIMNGGGTETLANFGNNGSVDLYYDNALKLSTKATGIDISGTATMDGLTVDGNPIINGTSPQIFLQTGASHTNWQIAAQENVANGFEISSGAADASAPDDTYTKRLVVQNNGNVSFYEDTGTTPKMMWNASEETLFVDQKIKVGNTTDGVVLQTSAGMGSILGVDTGGNGWNALDIRAGSATQLYLNTSGSVGIGTNAPATALDVVGTVTADGLTVDAGRISIDGGTDRTININNGSGADRFTINNVVASGATSITQTISYLSFVMGAAEAMRISSDGAVIVNNGGANNGILKINGATGNTEAVIFQRGGTEASRIGHANSADLAFYTGSGATERARLTSDGNLLVGKTGVDAGATAGFEFRQDLGGLTYLARAGNAITLNRLTTDGDIALFRKDGTSVGSIGVVGGRLYIGSDDTSIFFDSGATPSIRPHGPVDPDGIIDIGESGTRFKDLHLSGGVYLNGSGAANLLDDYEEGTWTPTIVGSTSGSITGFTVSEATYTKIGDTVRLSCYLASINMPTSTVVGNYRISGLPFSGDPFSDVINVSYCNMFSFDATTTSVSGYCGGSVLNLLKGSSLTAVTDADEGTSTAAAIMLSIVYKV